MSQEIHFGVPSSFYTTHSPYYRQISQISYADVHPENIQTMPPPPHAVKARIQAIVYGRHAICNSDIYNKIYQAMANNQEYPVSKESLGGDTWPRNSENLHRLLYGSERFRVQGCSCKGAWGLFEVPSLVGCGIICGPTISGNFNGVWLGSGSTRTEEERKWYEDYGECVRDMDIYLTVTPKWSATQLLYFT